MLVMMQPGNNSCTDVQVRLTKTITSATLLSILTERGLFMKRICPIVQFDRSSSIYLIFIRFSQHCGNVHEDSVRDTDSIWYCSAPLGEKTLGSMMPKLSLKYGLSERYTKHLIRVTSLQVLEDLKVALHQLNIKIPNFHIFPK